MAQQEDSGVAVRKVAQESKPLCSILEQIPKK
jgi:hypothetical protein